MFLRINVVILELFTWKLYNKYIFFIHVSKVSNPSFSKILYYLKLKSEYSQHDFMNGVCTPTHAWLPDPHPD